MLMPYCGYKLREIAVWRWFASLFFLLCTMMSTFRLVDINQMNLWEYMIYYLNQTNTVVFFLPFVLILLAGDCYNGTKNTFPDMVFLKLGNRKIWFSYMTQYLVLLCGIVLVCTALIAACTFFVFSETKMVFTGWNAIGLLVRGFSPVQTVVFTFVFVLCRMVFICLLMLMINLKVKTLPIGFLIVIALAVLDSTFYEATRMIEPLFLLPVEHSRMFYTEAFMPATGDELRGSILSSMLYWIVLLGGSLGFTYKIMLKKDFLQQEFMT